MSSKKNEWISIKVPIGKSYIKFNRLKYPRNKFGNKKHFEQAKKDIRKFAREIGVPYIQFRNTKLGISTYNLQTHRIIITKNHSNGKPQTRLTQLFHALHEIGHYIDHSIGNFSKFYNRTEQITDQDIKMIAYRVEQHADDIARKLMIAMFDLDPGETTYDKKFLYEYYGWT